MTYCSDDDVFKAFGRSNVRKWADVNNDQVESHVLERLEWAREGAYAYLNDKLRKSSYQFPLAAPASGDSYPFTVVRMEAYYAGVLLYESRGVTDVNPVTGAPMHALSFFKKEVESFIADVITRRITLDVAPAIETSSTPLVENEHDTDEDATSTEESEEAWFL
jgi:hypothetical protein